jgi:diadenosine tetraphosphate (Ap4A) HIT family hydrolase
VSSIVGCAFCEAEGGRVVFRHAKFRVVHASEPNFPGFYRLIWANHLAEFSDLSATDQLLCMQAVTAVEQALRQVCQPSKINLASFGNVVPHLHWHIIARFVWDTHFPQPFWGEAQRAVDATRLHQLQNQLPVLEKVIVEKLTQLNT